MSPEKECRRHDWVCLYGPFIFMADGRGYQARTTAYCARCERPKNAPTYPKDA